MQMSLSSLYGRWMVGKDDRDNSKLGQIYLKGTNLGILKINFSTFLLAHLSHLRPII